MTESGRSTPVSASARAPALATSHSTATPVASTARTVAAATSGPMPSPGINVILWAITRYYTIGAIHDSRLDLRASAHGRRAVASPRHHRRARAGRYARNTEAGVRSDRAAG